MRVGESTPVTWSCTGRNRAEREQAKGGRASRQRWPTVRAGCTAAHFQARLRAITISTPISLPATRQKRSPGDVKYRPDPSKPGDRRKDRCLIPSAVPMSVVGTRSGHGPLLRLVRTDGTHFTAI
jgi:hypothetical protein